MTHYQNLSDLLKEIPHQLAEQQKILALREAPAVEPGDHCTNPYDCEFYGLCNPERPEYWVGTLPRISKKKKKELLDKGIELIHDIPEDFGLTETQRRVCLCVKQDEPYFGKELSKELGKLDYPIYFMDFETFNPAIPRYAGMRPFDMIPFQWSVHVQRQPGSDPEHYEFLAEDAQDPRETFISSLLNLLEDGGGKGYIVTYYASFETGRLDDLANWVPQYASRIEKVKGRLWDLHPVIQNHVYHPEFYGSFSLKNVLPALVPGMTYDKMAIADGTQAGLAYDNMVKGGLKRHEIDELRKTLLEYCQQDTLGMVEMIRALTKPD